MSSTETGGPEGDKGSPPSSIPSSLFVGESKDLHRAMTLELRSQTDRGFAVLSAAYLEWRVRDAIRRRLPVWDKHVEKIFGNDKSPGELGFGDQCRMAYAIGLVGRDGLTDLHLVAQVRNRFAHHVEVTDFNVDKKIGDLCRAFKSPEIQHRRTEGQIVPTADWKPKLRFEFTVHTLSTMLWIQSTQQGIINNEFFW